MLKTVRKRVYMEESAIVVKNLVKRFKKAKENAVDGVNLDVQKGEIYGFLGPNGAGKSTTIKCIVRQLDPTGGEIYVSGVDAIKYPKTIRERIGVVFQEVSLDKNLKAEENLRISASLYGLTGFSLSYNRSSQEYKDRVRSVLELVELYDKKDEFVRSFSGGMKRRLDIAKAFLHKPTVLFLDEPTTGLDPQNRKNVWEYLVRLQRENGFTIFLTTQYLEEAEICNRISIIDKGKILVTDTPKKLKRSLGEEVLILDPEDDSVLEKELTGKNFTFSKSQIGEFVVDLKGERAQSVLKSIEAPLAEINIKKPTLDDVFIKYTGRRID
jgi:ABC-2 type transport system ATP-binding protein